MGVLSNLRGLKASTTTSSSHQQGLSIENGLPSVPVPRKKWMSFLPIFFALVVFAQIAFLGRLDMAKNAALLVDSWADSLSYKSSPLVDSSGVDSGSAGFFDRPSEDSGSTGEELGTGLLGNQRFDTGLDLGSCEEWLEREDAVLYSRDFEKEPILVVGGEKEWKTCAVGCHLGIGHSRTPDASFGFLPHSGTLSVLRSMESAQYYGENNIYMARRKGYQIVMTTSLSSDVPVGYFSWAEYDIMAPVQPKTEKALAAAFISNCGAHNFRLQALEALFKLKVEIDSYGACHRNKNGKAVDKVETLKRYKFSLAFENSNEEDYVTEKFFQSLVAGTIPVVIGAPNIEEFAPASGSILHIKELEDVETVAKKMKDLARNPDAYNHSLRWKYEGPLDSFKALVDMAAVHSSCRLCIHLATMIREKEENSPGFKKRPCRCTKGSETVHHLYVRERGQFDMVSIFLRSGNLTTKALESEVLKKFTSMKHVPVWKTERPESIRGGDALKIHRIYPVGLTQRQALYTFKFDGDAAFRTHLESKPCAKFEVIFV